MSGLYPMIELRPEQPYPIAQGLHPNPFAQGIYPMEQIAGAPHFGPMVPGWRSIAGAKKRRRCVMVGKIWNPVLQACVPARPKKLSKKAKKAIAGWNVNMRPYPCNGAM